MSYTGEELDDILRRLERAAEKVVANKNATVRLRASERDLLTEAEAGRNLLQKAVKGDKNLLEQVFGGTCERIGRIRMILDEVNFSDMHAGDARWSDLRNGGDSIEAVLKELGLYKPWAPPKVQPPSNVRYASCRSRFSPGQQIAMKVEFEGDSVSTFTVEPALPEGLELDAATGVISGKLPPDSEADAVTYVVTATNEAGSTNAELTFAVKVEAPDTLTYPSVPDHCHTGEPVQWEATVTGGSPVEWGVEPELPKGLRLTQQGAIQGIAVEGTATGNYTVLASNPGGEVSCTVSFEVRVAPPASLSYPEVLPTYGVGEAIALVPKMEVQSFGDATLAKLLAAEGHSLEKSDASVSYVIEPELPDGLVLDAATGVISGKATDPLEESVFNVAVSNEGGETTTELPLCFKLTPPNGLTYPGIAEKYYVGMTLDALQPEVDGRIEEWTIEPELPAGLAFDSGVISGTPTEEIGEGTGTWTVTAKNAEGDCSVQLAFAVVRAPPGELEYPELSGTLAFLTDVEFTPTVKGEVDEYSISPQLPEGMKLDAATGVISGRTEAITENMSYKVVAKNSTGSAFVEKTFGVEMLAPEELQYPRCPASFIQGEEVNLIPEVVGVATAWSSDPALPEGMVLDPSTGHITGAPTDIIEEVTYMVTVSNDAGEAFEALSFAVIPPAPTGISYPGILENFTVGEEVVFEPEVEGGLCSEFSIAPSLPVGMKFDTATGVITGAPEAPSEQTSYKVTATNIQGKASVVLEFACSEYEDAQVNEAFALQIDEITEIADLMEEPHEATHLGDWMIWMVHRAWLNDPTLKELDFTSKSMPYPYVEARIAPKLMEAMQTNTHMKNLLLPNANLQKHQGQQLAEALKVNNTLEIINVETNNLDSDAIRAIAEALSTNEKNNIEQFKCAHQKGVGGFFGRPVEEMVGQLMEKNTKITKLGFTCNDAHWRNSIDRAILRNNDLARRNRRRPVDIADELVAEEKTLSRLFLSNPPEKAVSELFPDDDPNLAVIRGYVAQEKRLPSAAQLQPWAKSNTLTPLKFSVVAPLIKDFRAKMLDSVRGTTVSVSDAYGAEMSGSLRTWSEKNETWALDIWPTGDTRFNFTDRKQPVIEVSDAYAAWLRPA